MSITAETIGTVTPDSFRDLESDDAQSLDRARAWGCATAETLGPAEPRPWIAGAVRRHTRSLRRLIYSGVAAHPAVLPHRNWLSENGRLIAATVKEIQEIAGCTRHLPALGSDAQSQVLRVCALADAFLDHVDARSPG